MKSGIELIAYERQEQIIKYGSVIDEKARENGRYQLAIAASKLLAFPAEVPNYQIPPTEWDIDVFKKMIEKPYKERLVIAGALIAAELDRLNTE